MQKSEVKTKMAAHKEDLRIIKTRASLSSTFFKMLADMELSEITVNRLCEESGVRRATFYKHFRDKDDFIIYIIKDIRAYFDTNIWNKDNHTTFTKEYYHKYAETLLAFHFHNEGQLRNEIRMGAHHVDVIVLVSTGFVDVPETFTG
jgi:AcrR family transcriptional regulator